ncbi:MAG: tetratricopeptide repeat protein, partial [Anaerolineae bacterium]
LDNYEHLLDGAGLVTDMLQAAAGLQIIVTSRARLNVQGEHLLPLGGMDLPPTDLVDPTCATQYSAVQLFLQGARRVEPDFALGDDNVADVIRICHLVEGIPLALLLAAAWLRALSPAEIAAEVEQGIDILASEGRDVPERQRSMRAVFDHSWRLLDAHQQQVLAALSVFRGGCTREAAQEVTGALTRDLMALVDRSLLQHTRAGRYEMHELLRQYAAERLTGSSRYTDVHDRHAAYYTRVLKEGYERYERHQREADLIQIAADIDNAQAAWDWAVARRRVADLQRAIQGLGTFYDRSVRYREGESVCRRAAEVLEEHASAEGLRVRAVVLKWQAKFLVSLGESARARTCYQRALALLDHLASEGEDTRCEEANALEAQVYEAIHRNLSEAENLAKRALGLYCELDDRVGQANALIALGFVAEIAERWQVARECYEASAALWQAMGHEWASVATRYRLAWVELALGHLDQAERRAQESYAFFRESKMPLFMWRTRGLLARVQMSRGQFAAAAELLADVLAHFQEMRDQPEARGTTHDLGFAGLHRGHYQEVEKLVRAIRAPGEKAGRREDYAESLLLEGQVSLAQRRYDSAAQYLQKSLDVH